MTGLNRMPSALLLAVGVMGASFVTDSDAATLSSGYTIGGSSQLLSANGGSGDFLFTDTAAAGGNQDPVNGGTADFNAVLLDGTGLWNISDTVSITGVALVIKGNNANQNSGTFTFGVREATNGTGASGGGGFPPVLGTATASYTKTNAVDTMWVNFDAPITFVADADSTTVGITFAFDGGQVAIKAGTDLPNGLQRYNYNNGNLVGGGTSRQRWSIAGTVVPEPSSLALLGLGGLACLRRRRLG